MEGLAALEQQMAAGRLMPAWAAYLFTSRVTYRILRRFGDAGHEWCIQRTWKRVIKRYGEPTATDDARYPAKSVYAVARSSAQTWLLRYVLCKRCGGKGCEACNETGQRFCEEPLDMAVHGPSYSIEHEALVRIELDERVGAMDAEQRALITAALENKPRRLGWLADQLLNRLSVSEALEDYEYLTRLEPRRRRA